MTSTYSYATLIRRPDSNYKGACWWFPSDAPNDSEKGHERVVVLRCPNDHITVIPLNEMKIDNDGSIRVIVDCSEAPYDCSYFDRIKLQGWDIEMNHF